MLSSNLVKILRITALLACTAAAFGAGETTLLDTMNQELQRNYQALKQKGDTPPYFMAYEITDLETHETGATLGVLNSQGNSHNRYLDVTVRVGDQKLDNFRRVRGDRVQFTSGAPVSIEDVPAALKPRMWLETDRVYRAAADRLIRIKTNQQVKAADRDQSTDFSSEEAYAHTEACLQRRLSTRPKWSQLVRDWSRDFRAYPDLLSSAVQVSTQADNRYLVNTEGTRVEHGRGFARIVISASAKAKDGMDVSDFETFEAFEASGLPSPEAIHAAVKKVGQNVEDLLKPPKPPSRSSAPPSSPAAPPASSSTKSSAIASKATARKTKPKARLSPRTSARRFCRNSCPSLSIPRRSRLPAVDLNGWYRI